MNRMNGKQALGVSLTAITLGTLLSFGYLRPDDPKGIVAPVSISAPRGAVAPTGPTGPCLEILHIGGKVIKGVMVWKWHGVAPTAFEDVCWWKGKA